MHRRFARLRPMQDIQIRRWTEQDYQPAAGIITAAYRAHIDSEINDQYRTNAGSMRFLNNIVRFPGCGVFDNDSSFVAIHKPSRALVGVILCSRIRHDVGHITQVCLLPEHRGAGIGENLIARPAIALAQSQRFPALADRDRSQSQCGRSLSPDRLSGEAGLRCLCMGRVGCYAESQIPRPRHSRMDGSVRISTLF